MKKKIIGLHLSLVRISGISKFFPIILRVKNSLLPGNVIPHHFLTQNLILSMVVLAKLRKDCRHISILERICCVCAEICCLWLKQISVCPLDLNVVLL